MWDASRPWKQQGSYVQPVAPPSPEPDAEPLVCVSFNASWLPYVIGSLMQLVQPSSWAASSPSALSSVLTASTELIERFGTATECIDVQLRVSGCELQISFDGGDTWETVSGWDTFTTGCLPISAPTNPLGTAHDQNACNLATYLATQLIQGALVSVVDSYNHTLTEVAATAAVIGLIPGWGTALSAGIDAGAGLYILVTGGTISAFTTASTSSTLLKSLQCAIYGAIVGAGSVTVGNFAAVQAAVHAIGYTSTPVQNAIDTFVANLGAAGMMQAQLVGGLYVGDCSTCPAPWCYKLDFTVAQGGSTQYGAAARGGIIVDKWQAGIGWHSNGYNIGGDGFAEAGCQIGFTAVHVTTIELTYIAPITSGGQGRALFAQNPLEVTTVASLALSSAAIGGDQTVTLAVNATISGVAIAIRTNQNTDDQAIRSITIRGTGVNPFGSSNCTP